MQWLHKEYLYHIQSLLNILCRMSLAAHLYFMLNQMKSTASMIQNIGIV